MVIHSAPRKPEVLAPAGKETVFHAVLEAGADAVYLAGKRFNMRRHRTDFNFSDADLKRLCETAHAAKRKFYVTVNAIIGPDELADLADYLRMLADTGADAVIVQDYAVVKTIRDLNLPLALHASTMMNVNSVEAAQFLKRHGFTRVVTSRDITLEALRRIGEGAGIETEYFIHGDMCTVQSGQCHLSGQIFGKSSNRGQCMKPCRWKWELRGLRSGQSLAVDRHLLATKDICMAGHLPEMIAAGLDSLKIEGRMKPADILVPIVTAYRQAIDRYFAEPLAAHRDPETTGGLFRGRVREFTTGFAFSAPDAGYIDPKGDREPIFLSYAGKQKTVADLPENTFEKLASATDLPTAPVRMPTLTALAGTMATAQAALAAGADTLILSWEGDLRIDSTWSLREIQELQAAAQRQGARFAVSSPAILTERELAEFRQAVHELKEVKTWLITSPAPLEFLRGAGKEIWLSPAFNLINPEAIEFFRREGATLVQPAPEASFADIAALAKATPRPQLDLQAHGPITGMLIEHCLPAMALLGISKQDFCRMPCTGEDYALVDTNGRVRRLKTDKYCRNHLLLEHDLSILPALPVFLRLGVDSFRLDLRLSTAEAAAALVKLWKTALATPAALPCHLAELDRISGGAAFSYGAFDRGVTGDDRFSTYKVMLEERHE